MSQTDDLLAKIVGVPRRDLPPRMYRCSVCLDVGWVETDPAGRGTWKRCGGPHSNGCPYEAWKRAEDIKRAGKKTNTPERSEFA